MKLFNLFAWVLPVGFLKLSFGGDSSSSQTQTTQQYDQRRVLGAGAMLAEGGSSINISTLDAVVANHAIDATVTGQKNAFSFAQKSQSVALDSLNVQANLIKDAYADAKGRGALTDKILIGAIAVSGLVAVMAIKK